MKQFFLSSLTKTINAYLKLDDTSQNRLQKLSGKAINVVFLPFHYTFQCIFTAQGVEIKEHALFPSDAIIMGTPLQLMSLLVATQDRQQFFAEDVVIAGDAEVAQQVMQLFEALEIDWEEQISHFIGDVPAYHMNRLVAQTCHWFKQTNQAFIRDINEYVHEEMSLFPAKEALQDFFNDIDQLRLDVDRMEARIHQIRNHLNAHEETK